MEALLSLAFDNLSSLNSDKIRKGLRQVEGLVAQICLSKSSKLSSAEKRRSMATPGAAQTAPKELGALREDPAFREFFKLQDGFEWNAALRLITCLDRLVGKGSDGQNDLIILSSLDLLQGILLLHPPSRSLFAREQYMNLLLDLLEPSNCPAIQSASLLILVCALLDQPSNTRTFETLDGLLTVTSLFKQRSTSREVKIKLVEFLYFYLMPEGPTTASGSGPAAALQRSPSKYAPGHGRNMSAAAATRADERTKTTEEKQALLGRYLSNVDDLVEDLRESAPFGGTLC